MADISMCVNKKCPSRLTCYRYTAKANPKRQSIMDFAPKAGDDRCDSYVDNKESTDGQTT